METHLSGEELIWRTLNRRCLVCSDGPLPIDHTTGFPRQLCDACERDRKNTKPAGHTSAANFTRKHRRDGLANLDRLMQDTEP